MLRNRTLIGPNSKLFLAGVIKDENLEQKLRKFQSLTGISETKYKELWEKRGKSIILIFICPRTVLLRGTDGKHERQGFAHGGKERPSDTSMSAEPWLKAMKIRLSQKITVRWQQVVDPDWFENLKSPEFIHYMYT